MVVAFRLSFTPFLIWGLILAGTTESLAQSVSKTSGKKEAKIWQVLKRSKIFEQKNVAKKSKAPRQTKPKNKRAEKKPSRDSRVKLPFLKNRQKQGHESGQKKARKRSEKQAKKELKQQKRLAAKVARKLEKEQSREERAAKTAVKKQARENIKAKKQATRDARATGRDQVREKRADVRSVRKTTSESLRKKRNENRKSRSQVLKANHRKKADVKVQMHALRKQLHAKKKTVSGNKQLSYRQIKKKRAMISRSIREARQDKRKRTQTVQQERSALKEKIKSDRRAYQKAKVAAWHDNRSSVKALQDTRLQARAEVMKKRSELSTERQRLNPRLQARIKEKAIRQVQKERKAEAAKTEKEMARAVRSMAKEQNKELMELVREQERINREEMEAAEAAQREMEQAAREEKKAALKSQKQSEKVTAGAQNKLQKAEQVSGKAALSALAAIEKERIRREKAAARSLQTSAEAAAKMERTAKKLAERQANDQARLENKQLMQQVKAQDLINREELRTSILEEREEKRSAQAAKKAEKQQEKDAEKTAAAEEKASRRTAKTADRETSDQEIAKAEGSGKSKQAIPEVSETNKNKGEKRPVKSPSGKSARKITRQEKMLDQEKAKAAKDAIMTLAKQQDELNREELKSLKDLEKQAIADDAAKNRMIRQAAKDSARLQRQQEREDNRSKEDISDREVSDQANEKVDKPSPGSTDKKARRLARKAARQENREILAMVAQQDRQNIEELKEARRPGPKKTEKADNTGTSRKNKDPEPSKKLEGGPKQKPAKTVRSQLAKDVNPPEQGVDDRKSPAEKRRHKKQAKDHQPPREDLPAETPGQTEEAAIESQKIRDNPGQPSKQAKADPEKRRKDRQLSRQKRDENRAIMAKALEQDALNRSEKPPRVAKEEHGDERPDKRLTERRAEIADRKKPSQKKDQASGIARRPAHRSEPDDKALADTKTKLRELPVSPPAKKEKVKAVRPGARKKVRQKDGAPRLKNHEAAFRAQRKQERQRKKALLSQSPGQREQTNPMLSRIDAVQPEKKDNGYENRKPDFHGVDALIPPAEAHRFEKPPNTEFPEAPTDREAANGTDPSLKTEMPGSAPLEINRPLHTPEEGQKTATDPAAERSRNRQVMAIVRAQEKLNRSEMKALRKSDLAEEKLFVRSIRRDERLAQKEEKRTAKTARRHQEEKPEIATNHSGEKNAKISMGEPVEKQAKIPREKKTKGKSSAPVPAIEEPQIEALQARHTPPPVKDPLPVTEEPDRLKEKTEPIAKASGRSAEKQGDRIRTGENKIRQRTVAAKEREPRTTDRLPNKEIAEHPDLAPEIDTNGLGLARSVKRKKDRLPKTGSAETLVPSNEPEVEISTTQPALRKHRPKTPDKLESTPVRIAKDDDRMADQSRKSKIPRDNNRPGKQKVRKNEGLAHRTTKVRELIPPQPEDRSDPAPVEEYEPPLETRLAVPVRSVVEKSPIAEKAERIKRRERDTRIREKKHAVPVKPVVGKGRPADKAERIKQKPTPIMKKKQAVPEKPVVEKSRLADRTERSKRQGKSSPGIDWIIPAHIMVEWTPAGPPVALDQPEDVQANTGEWKQQDPEKKHAGHKSRHKKKRKKKVSDQREDYRKWNKKAGFLAAHEEEPSGSDPPVLAQLNPPAKEINKPEPLATADTSRAKKSKRKITPVSRPDDDVQPQQNDTPRKITSGKADKDPRQHLFTGKTRKKDRRSAPERSRDARLKVSQADTSHNDPKIRVLGIQSRRAQRARKLSDDLQQKHREAYKQKEIADVSSRIDKMVKVRKKRVGLVKNYRLSETDEHKHKMNRNWEIRLHNKTKKRCRKGHKREQRREWVRRLFAGL